MSKSSWAGATSLESMCILIHIYACGPIWREGVQACLRWATCATTRDLLLCWCCCC
jgi:hypothetical protein